MSDIDQQKLNEKALPFFIRYLEEQDCQELSEEELTSVKGGCGIGKITTRKYRSHNKNVGGGKVVTLKYSSDNENVGGGEVVTLKYPSDNEDVGGGEVVTLKYPSDNEDAHTFTSR